MMLYKKLKEYRNVDAKGNRTVLFFDNDCVFEIDSTSYEYAEASSMMSTLDEMYVVSISPKIVIDKRYTDEVSMKAKIIIGLSDEVPLM